MKYKLLLKGTEYNEKVQTIKCEWIKDCKHTYCIKIKRKSTRKSAVVGMLRGYCEPVPVTCIVDQKLLAAQSRHVWCMDISGRAALHGVDTEPLCYQHRPLFRHHSPVSVRHQAYNEAHGRNDRSRLDSVCSHQHTGSVRLAWRAASGMLSISILHIVVIFGGYTLKTHSLLPL